MIQLDTETILKYGARLIIIFMVTPLHEFAHAWSAEKMGDPTPRYQNRVNLNPFNHIDPLGAMLTFFCGFGWGKPVQVNQNNFKKPRKGLALCAAAGPISNICVALFGTIVFKIFTYCFVKNPTEAIFWATVLCKYFVVINIGLAVFNLIPIYPLDGSRILSYFTSFKFDRKVQKYSLYIFIGFAVLVVTGALNGPLGWIDDKVLWVMDKLTFWVDPIIKSILKI